MITEKEFRGEGYNYTLAWSGSTQTKKASLTRGRMIRFTADNIWSGCKFELPYAPMLMTGGPSITLIQASHQTPFDVHAFGTLAGTKLVTVPVRDSWDFLAVTFHLVWNVGLGGTWKYYFRRGYSFS